MANNNDGNNDAGNNDAGNNDDNNGGGNNPDPGNAVVDTSALNQQIVQAVDKTNSVMISSAQAEGAGIAYQKVAQAAAFSVQDATDYLRNIMAMGGATQGVCLEKMIIAAESGDPKGSIPKYKEVVSAAQQVITFAESVFSDVGEDAGVVAGEFPKSS
jgi:hypothetical protein